MTTRRSTILDTLSGHNRSISGGLARAGLAAIEPVYRVVIALRNTCFDRGWRRIHRLPRPTISVGNITTGGTGKTPMVIELAERLSAMGAHAAVLLRGYQAGPDGSDEAALLREALGPGVPVEADPNRLAGADRILIARPDVHVFLLDDGFQHRRVARDLDIVLIDATEPFGFGHVLPRGLLREPIKHLRRADAVIVTRCDQVAGHALEDLDQRIERITGRRPTAHAAHRWDGFIDAEDRIHAIDFLRDRRVVGVCGIGNPAAFTNTLKRHAPQTDRIVAFPDHHAYTAHEIDDLIANLADPDSLDALVTTDKDWVKWKQLAPAPDWPVPVYRPILRMELLDGSDALNRLLRETLEKAG